jgi:hypothetical protein
MLLIYSAFSSPRLLYTFDLIFKDIFGIEYSLTHDVEAFRKSEQPKISYGSAAVSDELFFESAYLLFEKDIRKQNISVTEWNGLKIFFQTSQKSIFPFDVFAATFYLVSRYEEYLPFKGDSLGRFSAKESLAYQNDFLQKPLVNIWAEKIKVVIKQRYPDFSFPQKKYQFISTIDIDNAYAYKHKGLVRTVGGFVKDVLKLNFKNAFNRLSTILNLKQDVYDTYAELSNLQSKYKFPCIYFFLLGDFDERDKNLPSGSKKLQSLIQHLANTNDCGIHPSFASNSNPEKISVEKKRLTGILKKEVTKSRQHFLMLRFPETYWNLIANGITDDYTMGYADEVGFRAGICTSFYFFDLQKNETASLRIHPFAVMDATLNLYLKISPDQAISHVQALINATKAVNGTFISIWHNESLSEVQPWKGWKSVYKEIIKAAVV